MAGHVRHRELYVIVTCQRVGGKLQALTVHIEYRHPRRKRS
jgi:hypothetical protein